jgi:cytochrome P450
MPFSRGPRACLGIHLATLELKQILSTLIANWEISIGPRTTDGVMEMRDHFVLMPKGGFCDLIFRPVNTGGN